VSVDLIKSIHFHEVARPLKVPFATALGRKEVMRSIIVRVALTSGSIGLGECPTSSAFKKETIPVIKRLLAQWIPAMKGMPINYREGEIISLRRRYSDYPMTLSGLEVALFRAGLNGTGTSEHSYWGGLLNEVETDITVPFIPGHSSLAKWIESSIRMGFTIFKIKVSGDVEQDKRFITAVCEIVSRGISSFVIRLDGNQGYSVKTFGNMIGFLEKSHYRVELFEQPLRRDDYRGLKEIRRYSPFPVILDESVATAKDLQRAIDENLCHGVNVKMAKSGIHESSAIVRLAKSNGLKTMIGCMTETMTGLSAAIYFAAGSGSFDYADLDGIYFLRHRKRYGAVEIRSPRFLISEPVSGPA
jgi:L-alanine-DL-glutamate epimerase-like enolase superfamily enzyme